MGDFVIDMFKRNIARIDNFKGINLFNYSHKHHHFYE